MSDTASENEWLIPEDGWAYVDFDSGDEVIDLREGREDLLVDLTAQPDVELLALHYAAPSLFDELSPFEREVVGSRFGLGDYEERSIKQMHRETGVPKNQLRGALGSALDKMRQRLEE